MTKRKRSNWMAIKGDTLNPNRPWGVVKHLTPRAIREIDGPDAKPGTRTEVIAEVCDGEPGVAQADAERIVDCVNGCDCITHPNLLEQLLRVIKLDVLPKAGFDRVKAAYSKLSIDEDMLMEKQPTQPTPNTAEKSHDYMWRLFYVAPTRHKWYCGVDKNGVSRVAACDYSGDTPDKTDDGVIWLDESKTIVIECYRNEVNTTNRTTLGRLPTTIPGIKENGDTCTIGGARASDALELRTLLAAGRVKIAWKVVEGHDD